LFRRARADAGPTVDDTDYADDDAEDAHDLEDVDADDNSSPPVRAVSAEPDDELNLKPSELRGSEVMYGYMVAFELIVVSILNLTVTHGPGAPTGSQRLLGANLTPHTLSVIGLLASIALIGVVYWVRHRFVVAFAGIIAAFFVTLPKVPNTLTVAHLIALVVPVVYAFILTQRQRKASLAQSREGGRSASTRSSPADRRAGSTERRRNRRKGPETTGPKANRRYTPPKPKRNR
jgi:hypothetical protein